MSRQRVDDEGLILVWVGVMMVVLLGFGALVIDVGALYREKRELQNGADAAALAVAKDCAGPTGCAATANGLAQTYADGNAHDGASTVDSVCGVGGGLGGCATTPDGTAGATGWVKVDTSTRSDDGGSKVTVLLAPIIGAAGGETVNASAIAAWGAARTAETPPLVMAECAYQSTVGGGSLPSPELTLYFHNPTGQGQQANGPCTGSPPGGFGWISTDGCTKDVDLSTGVPSDPGNNAEKQQGEACFAKAGGTGRYEPGDLVPVGLFTTFQGSGSGATYTVVGIAGFRITAYRFPSTENPDKFKCPINNENSCLQGHFEALVTVGEFGGGTNYGVSVVKMIG